MVDAVCAGHICLDIAPDFGERPVSVQEVFVPGRMTDVGPLGFSAGGSTANVGLALEKLGFSTAIMAKIGDDHLGELTVSTLEENGASAKHLAVGKGEDTSYSIVLSVPDCPRMFLHDPAVNGTFGIENIDFDTVADAKVFHLGYAMIVKRLYENGGEMLTDVLKKAKECGATTSLDTAMPDPGTEGARCDWPRIFARCLPYTDIFCPSLEELLLVTDPSEYYRLESMDQDILRNITLDQISAMGSRMIGMGAKIVLIKCGHLGSYLITAPRNEMESMGRAQPADLDAWAGRELFSATFRVRQVQSAIGAGSVTIAGFLGAFMRGLSPEECLTMGSAAAACCVASVSAVDDLPSFDDLKQRAFGGGWQKDNLNYTGGRFEYDPDARIYRG